MKVRHFNVVESLVTNAKTCRPVKWEFSGTRERTWNHGVVCAQSHHPTWLCQRHEGQHWATFAFTVAGPRARNNLPGRRSSLFITGHFRTFTQVPSFLQCFFCLDCCDFLQRLWSDCVLFTALYKLTVLHYITLQLRPDALSGAVTNRGRKWESNPSHWC